MGICLYVVALQGFAELAYYTGTMLAVVAAEKDVNGMYM